MSHLYNEIESNADEWLFNLMLDGEIPAGRIDARPIQELVGRDFDGVTQFHTFAGIGGWALALKLAGWPEDKEVWTGSCPCQPYSSAGKQKGNADERDLWPALFALIKERRPKFIFGEQVASAIKHGWLDRVYTDLEGIGYTVGAAVLGAHSVGANHIRQRLYWGAYLGPVRDASMPRHESERSGQSGEPEGRRGLPGVGREIDGLAQDPSGLRRRGRDVRRDEGDTGELEPQGEVAGSGLGGGVADGLGILGGGRPGEGPGAESGVQGEARQQWLRDELGAGGPISSGLADDDDEGQQERGQGRPESDRCAVAPGGGPWSDFRLVLCTDGKARRTGARVFPLAYGLPRGVGDGGSWRKGLARSASRARIGMLKGSGNAIVPTLAAEFITAFMESL